MKGKRELDNIKDVTYNMAGWAGSYMKDAAEL